LTTLQNYPNYSQLSARTNGPNDCVPTSIKDAVKYLTGEELDLDGMVTAVYGPNYHGFTSAKAFVPYIAQHGVKLFPIDGDNATLVKALHEQIQALRPCLLTEPDPYAPLHPDWSHVLSVYREDPGTITARDPYSVHDVTHTDTEWQSLLEFREIWAMESLNPTQQGDLPVLQLTDPMGQFFTQVDASHWHCNPTNVDLIYGHLAFYRQYQGIFGLPRFNEIYLASMPGTAIMVYERAIAIYDPVPRHATNEAPPGASVVYLMHTDGGGTGIGQQQIAKPLLAALQAQVAQLQAQLAQDTSAELTKQLASYQAAVKQVEALIHPLVV
jgi:hypothetical protein